MAQLGRSRCAGLDWGCFRWVNNRVRGIRSTVDTFQILTVY